MTTPRTMQDILRQQNTPVLFRPKEKGDLHLRLPYRPDNYMSLLKLGKKRPTWDNERKKYKVPRSWFEEVIRLCLQRFGTVYLIQAYNEDERCAPACMTAKGMDCECSCMGKNHGVNYTGDHWNSVDDAFPVWKGKTRFSCRVVRRV